MDTRQVPQSPRHRSHFPAPRYYGTAASPLSSADTRHFEPGAILVHEPQAHAEQRTGRDFDRVRAGMRAYGHYGEDSDCCAHDPILRVHTVSYTHLTLPTSD